MTTEKVSCWYLPKNNFARCPCTTFLFWQVGLSELQAGPMFIVIRKYQYMSCVYESIFDVHSWISRDGKNFRHSWIPRDGWNYRFVLWLIWASTFDSLLPHQSCACFCTSVQSRIILVVSIIGSWQRSVSGYPWRDVKQRLALRDKSSYPLLGHITSDTHLRDFPRRRQSSDKYQLEVSIIGCVKEPIYYWGHYQ